MKYSDAELVSQSLTGSREAFGRIVEQYQSLICSLAYSATGSLTQSEDVAQETFVVAWKKLRQLREPEKLRAWLCSIARSVISGVTRRQTREPAHGAETLDTIRETPANEPIPSERAINREEEAILWRSLAQIPEVYREPLVLFYREQQSVASVAGKLELSEDAVKQRLSRGRKLLSEEVTAFVEGTLARTNPGKVFTLGVLAALPLLATSAKAAAIGATAAKGSATAKAAATVGLFGVLFAPVIGILAGVLGTKINIDSACSPGDRRFKIKMAWLTWSIIAAFNIVLFGGGYLARPYWTTYPVLFTWSVIVVTFVFVISIWTVVFWSIRHMRRMNREATGGASLGGSFTGSWGVVRNFEYRSPVTLLGWPLIHIRFAQDGRWVPVKAWIACGNIAYGILFAYGGVAVGAVSMGGVAVGGVTIGGCALGLLAFGGMGLGYFATGGLAMGYMACGGAAIAWQAACGGAAVAHDYALGGAVLAQHANDSIARAFARNSMLLSHAYLFVNLSILFSCLSMVPGVIYWRKQSRRQPTIR
ncbi:MAG: sigma-70 family RNA polymerase sigma factor [Verrucomicrobiia bacterium]